MSPDFEAALREEVDGLEEAGLVAHSPAEDIDHPARYVHGTIECWDYIVDKEMGYLEGNIIKYITRYKHKNGVEDLKKARNYLDKLIDTCNN